jgi:hypothetical protein
MAGMSAWTLDELVRRAARALATSDVRAPNGRVTELPDARVIRWYATKGIVDRPSGTRGRSALYGPRHLLQIVAVKRLQARGLSLAEIQARLAGATDATLRQLADLPTDSIDSTDAQEYSEPALSTPGHRPARFWAEAPPTVASEPGGVTSVPGGVTSEPGGVTSVPGGASADRDGVLHGVALADGVLLLLPGTPNPDDLDAIRAASGPLIETLSRRGLTTRTEP